MYAQASSWTEEDMRRLAGAARAASDRRPDLAAARAMGGGVVAPLVFGGTGGDWRTMVGDRGFTWFGAVFTPSWFGLILGRGLHTLYRDAMRVHVRPVIRGPNDT